MNLHTNQENEQNGYFQYANIILLFYMKKLILFTWNENVNIKNTTLVIHIKIKKKIWTVKEKKLNNYC